MNINAMMKQAKKMQDDIDSKKKELEKKEFTIEKQGITTVIKGDRTIKSIKIHEALVDSDEIDILEDMIVISINAANSKIDEELEALTPQSNGMPF